MTRISLGVGLLVVLVASVLAWRLGLDAGSLRPPSSPTPPSIARDAEQDVARGASGLDDGLAPPGVVREASPLVVPAAVDTEREPRVSVLVTTLWSRSAGRDATQPPAPGRAVALGVSGARGRTGDVLLELETGADGRARVDVPWRAIAAISTKSPQLWARSEGDGALLAVAWVAAPGEPGGEVEIVLTLTHGTSVAGRLLGPDDEPASGRLEVWFESEAGLSRRLAVGQAGSDGRFSLDLRDEGTTRVFGRGTSPDAAQSGGRLNEAFVLGTGISEPFEVRFDVPVPDVEVRLSGPGVLRGRVLDERGQPSAGVQLSIRLAGSSERTPQDWTVEGQIEREGRGHVSLDTDTDAEGAFLARGLRAGDFVIAAKVSGERWGEPTVLTPDPVPSDGKPLELRLSRSYLAIHVRGLDGEPPGDDFGVHSPNPWDELDAWPEEPGVLVTYAPEDVRRGGWAGAYLSPRQVGAGEFILEVDAGASVDVGVMGGSLPWTSRRVTLPEVPARVDVDVTLPAALPSGELVLSVLDAAGDPVVDVLRLRVVDPATGVVVLERSSFFWDEDDWPQRVALPAGEYLLCVEGHAAVDSHHGTLMDPRLQGGWEGALDIGAGSETHVVAVLDRAARLRVLLLGEADDADRSAVQRGASEFTPEGIDEWASKVTLSLERAGRWPERVEFARRAMEGTSAAGVHLMSTLAFGAEETSQALGPGAYTLVGRTPGGRIVRRPITLVDGETLDVTLAFD